MRRGNGTQDGYIAKTNGWGAARSPIMEQGFASRRSRVRSRKFSGLFALFFHTRARSLVVDSPPSPRFRHRALIIQEIYRCHWYLHPIASSPFLFFFPYSFLEQCAETFERYCLDLKINSAKYKDVHRQIAI